jgi:soluble lytic murein transglycosylase-like protein
MDRARVSILGFVAAVLVFDGSSPPTVVTEPAVDAGPTMRVAFDESAVAARLSKLNSVLTEREALRIAAAVMKYSAKYDLDPQLVTAVMEAESTARPWVRSPKGAVGLMQVMPYMAGRMEMAGNLTTIESNIEAGCLILADNIRRLGEDDGISAYFWGSRIRGVSYLQRVQAARARIRGET